MHVIRCIGKHELRNNNVASITVQEEKITGTFKTPAATGLGTSGSSLAFTTYLPSYGDDELSVLLEEKGVRFTPGGIRKGGSGYDICFIHPKGNEAAPIGGEGVLIELVQAPPEVVDAFRQLAGGAGGASGSD